MKTRDEFIAETAREFDIHGRLHTEGNRLSYDTFEAIEAAENFADDLETRGVIPWREEPEEEQTPVSVALLALTNAAHKWAHDRSVANRRVLLSLALTYVEATR